MDDIDSIDGTVDGAGKVDPQLNRIKGGGLPASDENRRYTHLQRIYLGGWWV